MTGMKSAFIDMDIPSERLMSNPGVRDSTGPDKLPASPQTNRSCMKYQQEMGNPDVLHCQIMAEDQLSVAA